LWEKISMKVKSDTLISELIDSTHQNLNFLKTLNSKSDSELNWREDEKSWSILECIEHLNLYGDFYLPEIERVIRNSRSKTEELFKSGVLGNYFAKAMLPKAKLNKMKTFKDKNPSKSNLNRNTFDRFERQQIQLIDLLNKARNINLNKEKTNITITKLIKLKIGDTFRFVINHNTRHINQIERISEFFY